MPFPIPRNPVRQLRRYRQIGATFVRHGFGFAWDQLQPAMRFRLRRRGAMPDSVPTETMAAHFRLALEELGPTFVKLGQVLSTRPDILPVAYISELTKLQDRVPPAPWSEVRAVLEEEYGRPPEQVFLSIDPEPLAAASLAQVHAATLPQGTQVVVKVQRDRIRQVIDTDLQIMAEVAAAGQMTRLGRVYDLPAIVEDFANTLRNELNYRREGRNADRLRENFHAASFVHIPRIFWDFTTERVLVLERLTGIRIDDIAAMEAAGVDRHRVALHSAQVLLQEVLQDGFFHADPHPGNFVVIMPGEVFGAMDFGMVGHLDAALRLDLLRLYAASVDMDAPAVVEQMIRMEVVAGDADRRSLTADITRLIHKYRGMSLQEIRASEVVRDLMPITFRHRLRFPTDLWLLGKTLSMMEGLGLSIDPDFDIFAITEPIVRKMLWRTMSPNRSWQRELIFTGLDWADVARRLPQAGAQILRQAERGELFTMHVKGLDDLIRLLDRAATRLAISLVIAAMILGTALLLPATSGNLTARILVIAGFVISLGMGAWLAVSMWRSFRSRG